MHYYLYNYATESTLDYTKQDTQTKNTPTLSDLSRVSSSSSDNSSESHTMDVSSASKKYF